MKRKQTGDVIIPHDSISLQVICLTGEGITLNVPSTTLGQEVHRMVSEQLPGKRGTKLALHHMESKLVLRKTLHEQNITGAARLSCTRIPVNVYDAWCTVKGLRNVDESAMQGVTKLDCAPPGENLSHLPQTLESLSFHVNFNQNLERVTLPSGLQCLTFGYDML